MRRWQPDVRQCDGTVMANSRKKPGSKAAAKGKAKPRVRTAPHAAYERAAPLRTAFGYVVPTVVALAVVVGVVFGLPKLRDRASYRLRYEDGVSIFVELPADEPGGDSWLKGEFATDLHLIAAQEISAHPDVLSRKQLDAVRIAVARTGWFEGDPIVRRTRGQIHISGEWRVPAAVVRYEDREYLISWRGHLLPKSYPAGEAYPTDHVRVITGVTFGPPADDQLRLRFGVQWPGAEVRAALELLALVHDEPYAADIAGIDVSRRETAKGINDNELLLTIVTPDDSRVIWGSPPNVSGVHRGEVSREQKLANLLALHDRFGRIDAGRQLVEVFRHDVGFESAEGGP